jgi:uncharacterized protein YndB with AHSA1/START domain
MKRNTISVHSIINAPIEKVWKCWVTPDDIIQWNSASSDWHTTKAVNDLREDGTFTYRMEAKDGSMGFDFGGVYNKVIVHKLIYSSLGDGRKVNVVFSILDNYTEIIETFEAETTNSLELQRGGWQAILDNFKKYVEGK